MPVRFDAIIEPVFADLIGPSAGTPTLGPFAANAAWPTCAALAHNLPRATSTPTSPVLRDQAQSGQQ